MHPLARISSLCAGEGALVAGCLSGTSADGIDVGIARFRTASEQSEGELEPPLLLAYRTVPFEPALAERVRAVLDADSGASIRWSDAALLSRDLGLAFGRAVRAVADDEGVTLDLIGSHGQTVWHHDGTLAGETGGAATVQLGGGAFVAHAAGTTTVSDFRQADIAAGGEGAPLSALVDPLLFRSVERPAAILNLGGIANVTLLVDPVGPRNALAFDTGPAGSLLDGLARRLLDRPFDAGGDVASAGRVDENFLDRIARHPFFDRPPPKSTGRDTFGEAWVAELIAAAEVAGLLRSGPADLFATAVELVARSVAEALERFGPARLATLVVAGGGTHNRALMSALSRRVGLPATDSSALGVDPDAREALVFAALALRCALGLGSSKGWATGAADGARLGAVHFPPAASAAGTGEHARPGVGLR